MCLITFSEEVRFCEWNARDCEELTNDSSFKKNRSQGIYGYYKQYEYLLVLRPRKTTFKVKFK